MITEENLDYAKSLLHILYKYHSNNINSEKDKYILVILAELNRCLENREINESR